jgi:hypothetical protein
MAAACLLMLASSRAMSRPAIANLYGTTHQQHVGSASPHSNSRGGIACWAGNRDRKDENKTGNSE